MRGRSVTVLSVGAMLLFIGVLPAGGQWVEDGISVSAALGGQDYCDIAPDGFGGAIVVWRDNRNANYDIYAQRLDALGNPMWATDGVPVCTQGNGQHEPKIVSDGAGGAVIAWHDYRGGEVDVYAQRLDASGSALWTPDGVAVCTATNVQYKVVITTDGAGGAIIAWEDRRNPSDEDIYAQRIDGSGNPLWTANGEIACNAANSQTTLRIASDGRGGAHIVWQDWRSGSSFDVYAQRFDQNGSTFWGTGGYGVCTAANSQWEPRVTNDGFGGSIYVWHDYRNGGTADIYAMRITESGGLAWTSGGVAICTAAQNQDSPELVPDGTGGAIIAWRDFRSGLYGAYAQRIQGDASIQWAADGITVCSYASGQENIRMVSDGTGGAIVTWEDSRMGRDDVYCQRLDASGNRLWASLGLAVTNAFDNQVTPRIAADGNGGAIIAWKDYRSGTDDDIYAQRIERNGYWGFPAPEIASVSDVPADQGGYVNLAWDASRLDPWPDLVISYYSLWRAVTQAHAAAMLERGGELLSGISVLRPGSDGPVIRWEMANGSEYYWELVTTQDANGYESYAKTLPTPYDSTGTDGAYYYYQVCAHASDPQVNWTSAPDSGYSVDNLAPAQPQSLVGEQSLMPDGLTLVWDPNTEDDLAHYAVYRGVSLDFVPSPVNLIASPTDTTAFDTGWTWDGGYYYKVSAIDIHGNESIFAVLVPDEVTGTGEIAAPLVTFLSQNYPNPFAATTTISFGLREASEVSLEVYDVAGRLVRVLVDERRVANRFTEFWDGRDADGRLAPSGIYFYKLNTTSFRQTKKMLLLR